MEGEMGKAMIKDDDDCLKDRTCYPRRRWFSADFGDNYGGVPCLQRLTRLNVFVCPSRVLARTHL